MKRKNKSRNTGGVLHLTSRQGDVQVEGDVVGRDKTVVIFQGENVTIPSSEAVARHRSALEKKLEAENAAWSLYIREEGAALPVEASPYQTGLLGKREDLLHLLHAANRLLVLGEPGAGKSVSLQRLAWELCGDSKSSVHVLLPLFHYAGAPLAEWVRALLQETGELRLDDEQALNAFLQEGNTRCVFLFDGLNEVAPSYRDWLVDELIRWIKAHPHHPVILTSRSQDELWRRLRGEVERVVVIQPIRDEQAQDYLVKRLGSKKGDELYERLDEQLRALARNPLVLWLIKEAGEAGESVPGNRGELYARFVSRLLRRDTDRRMDADFPERVKKGALASLAFHLSRKQQLICSREEAIRTVAEVLGQPADQAEGILGACARHGLLAGEESLRFAPHQTVQEHFAAWALVEHIKREQGLSRGQRLWRSVRSLLTGQEDGLVALAAEDWWMETFVQLAGLVEEADGLARDIARVNAWLAWWCVTEGRGVTSSTWKAVTERSVGLLDSPRVRDRRRSVAALARMRSERVMRPLLRAAADEDPEVAGLAVQALVEMDEAAQPLVEEALRGTDRRLQQGVIRYLAVHPQDGLCQLIPPEAWEAMLGQPMVWVPPGPFLMGSDPRRDREAIKDEFPQHEVMLPGYWIGHYPVTVVQFRTFVRQSGYTAYDDRVADIGNYPVTYISRDNAIAYCRWLSTKSRLIVRLPTEAEWEKAARGTDGRIYPWGDEFDNNKCNSWEAGIGTKTPVGTYSPAGDSPYGCADMAGNVWEWCSSLEKPYPYKRDDGREDLKASGRYIVHGGSFNRGAWYARCAYRDRIDPGSWYDFIGFRVVAVPFLQ